MAETKSAKKSKGFTDEERAAMKERVQEMKAAAGKAEGEAAALAKIAAMPAADRALGQRLHAIIKASAPSLAPKTWYGMPAYAKGDDIVCYFRDTKKFKERYVTLFFNDAAKLDEGQLWPVAFALTGLTASEEARVAALVKRAVG